MDDPPGVQELVDDFTDGSRVGKVWARVADKSTGCVRCGLVLLGVLRSLPRCGRDAARESSSLLRAHRCDRVTLHGGRGGSGRRRLSSKDAEVPLQLHAHINLRLHYLPPLPPGLRRMRRNLRPRRQLLQHDPHPDQLALPLGCLPLLVLRLRRDARGCGRPHRREELDAENLPDARGAVFGIYQLFDLPGAWGVGAQFWGVAGGDDVPGHRDEGAL